MAAPEGKAKITPRSISRYGNINMAGMTYFSVKMLFWASFSKPFLIKPLKNEQTIERFDFYKFRGVSNFERKFDSDASRDKQWVVTRASQIWPAGLRSKFPDGKYCLKAISFFANKF